MTKLYCFDVDGTLSNSKMNGESEYIRGIIPTSVIVDILAKGDKVAIVSPSPFYPEGFENLIFARNGSNDYRFENIKDAMRHYNIEKRDVVYVDDLLGNLKSVFYALTPICILLPEDFIRMKYNNIL